MRPAVFFDRDGVLNQDKGYLHKEAQFQWMLGAREAVRAVNVAGYFAFVVTNQSGVARGLFKESDVEALHNWMAHDLAQFGARIDAFEYCPHHPEVGVEPYRTACNCRKPKSGMIVGLMNRFQIESSRSFLIGDRCTDVEAAAGAGISGYLFDGGNLEIFVRRHLRNYLVHER